MTAPPALSIVLPLYRTRAAVPELVSRLRASIGGLGPAELVFVDDACPERSADAVLAQPVPRQGPTVVVVRHERNAGQLAAVMTGLRMARGDVLVVMDADLQDAPEDVPRLVARLAETAGRYDAVAAGRRGHYETPARELTGRLYRGLVHRLSHGRIPADAGLFLAMTRDARDRVLGLDDPAVHLVPALGRVGARVGTEPVERRPRPAGESAYRRRARLALAVRAALVLTPLYPVLRRWDRRRGPGVPAATVR